VEDSAVDDVPRPGQRELDARSVEVLNCARRVAFGDSALVRRGDMDPEDVAQDIAEQYLRRRSEPVSLMGWAATATRCRLIDLANGKPPIPVDDAELGGRLGYGMGPSASVVSRDQYQRIVAVLGQVQQAVINEHLTGATNEQIARAHGYASAAVAASTISRIKKDLRTQFPDVRFDLAPQRVYLTTPRLPTRTR
jgi:hypothetical protein